MKRFFSIVFFMFLVGFAEAQRKDTTNKVQLTLNEEQMQRLWQILVLSRDHLFQTEVPARTIMFGDSLTRILVDQSKKWHPEAPKNSSDSTGKK